MELHKAIQQIIKAHGKNTLQEPRLLNMLNDYQAYKANPACKFFVSSLFNEGVIALLMSYGQWNTQCNQLVNQVSKTTGFQVSLVSLVLKSFAFGLGWLKESDIFNTPNNPNPPKPKPTPPAPQSPPTRARNADDLERMVQINSNVLSLTGVRLSGFSFEFLKYPDNAYYKINCEMERIGKAIKADYYYIVIALYDLTGRVRLSDDLFCGEKIPSFETISNTYSINKSVDPTKLSKIIVYAKTE